MVSIDNNQKMKHFRKWAEGRNLFLAAVSLSIASFSTECDFLFKSIDSGKRIEGDIPLPKLKTWLKLYQNHKRIINVLIDIMMGINDDSAKEAKIYKLYNEGAKKLQEHPEKIQQVLKNLTQDERKEIIEKANKKNEEFLEITINDLTSDFNAKENLELRNNFRKPEFLFLFRVLVPCFTLYNTYPVELIRRAQTGDDDALEKLIRLDKSIIFNPKISELIHQAQAMKAQARISMIKKAFTSKPLTHMKIKTIKCQLGGLISYFSIVFEQKISAVDIWKLYDALALDTTGDIDQDLGEMTPETFAKEIQNARKMWHVIL